MPQAWGPLLCVATEVLVSPSNEALRPSGRASPQSGGDTDQRPEGLDSPASLWPVARPGPSGENGSSGVCRGLHRFSPAPGEVGAESRLGGVCDQTPSVSGRLGSMGLSPQALSLCLVAGRRYGQTCVLHSSVAGICDLAVVGQAALRPASGFLLAARVTPISATVPKLWSWRCQCRGQNQNFRQQPHPGNISSQPGSSPDCRVQGAPVGEGSRGGRLRCPIPALSSDAPPSHLHRGPESSSAPRGGGILWTSLASRGLTGSGTGILQLRIPGMSLQLVDAWITHQVLTPQGCTLFQADPGTGSERSRKLGGWALERKGVLQPHEAQAGARGGHPCPAPMEASPGGGKESGGVHQCHPCPPPLMPVRVPSLLRASWEARQRNVLLRSGLGSWPTLSWRPKERPHMVPRRGRAGCAVLELDLDLCPATTLQTHWKSGAREEAGCFLARLNYGWPACWWETNVF